MNKQELRTHFLALRHSLSPERRKEAARELLRTLVPYCSQFDRIASFCNTPYEIDMGALNQIFSNAGRLLLPACIGQDLQYYCVKDLSLLRSAQYGLLEPDPNRCALAELTRRDLILVPGLAFDAEHFRLGAGKGCFDKFLARHLEIPNAGVGFLEQKSEIPLPRDSWDVPVKTLFLF